MYVVEYRIGKVKYQKVLSSYKECMEHKESLESEYGTTYNYYIRSLELLSVV